VHPEATRKREEKRTAVQWSAPSRLHRGEGLRYPFDVIRRPVTRSAGRTPRKESPHQTEKRLTARETAPVPAKKASCLRDLAPFVEISKKRRNISTRCQHDCQGAREGRARTAASSPSRPEGFSLSSPGRRTTSSQNQKENKGPHQAKNYEPRFALAVLHDFAPKGTGYGQTRRAPTERER